MGMIVGLCTLNETSSQVRKIELNPLTELHLGPRHPHTIIYWQTRGQTQKSRTDASASSPSQFHLHQSTSLMYLLCYCADMKFNIITKATNNPQRYLHDRIRHRLDLDYQRPLLHSRSHLRQSGLSPEIAITSKVLGS